MVLTKRNILNTLGERPAHLLSELEIQMAVVKRPAVNVRKDHKTSVKLSATSPTAATREVKLRAGVGASPSAPAVFDPHLFVRMMGKHSREYPDKTAIFSQGDAADAVFYIRNGKVKLTVVSKRGKEAVIAILLEGSFFGEGCLAGQALRMSSAHTVSRSVVIRVEKSAMLARLHQDPKFAERFLAYLLSRNIRHGSRLGGSPL